jgi:phosphoglycolate phosphatase
MTFKAIIFDMDGTLINSVDDIADAMNLVLRQNNYPVHHVDYYIKCIGDGLKNLVISALPQKYREEAIIDKCLEEMKDAYSVMWMNKSHLYPGIAELLSTLRNLNIKMGVLSNKHHNFTQIIADKLLAEWKFDVVMGYREGYPVKPDPTSALEIARIFEVDPSLILYVGDSSTDMLTAINAGMYPVGVGWGYRSTESLIKNGALKILDQPNELLTLF